MTSSLKLNPTRFLQDASNRAAYLEWLNNPITQRVREIAQVMATPMGISGENSNSALYEHGKTVGHAQMSRLIFEMELFVLPESAGEEPVADYGAYTSEEIRFLKEFQQNERA